MKVKILLTVLMITMISLTISTNANAHPYPRHYRGGWHHPRVSVLVPPVPIPVPAPRVVIAPGCAPRYYGSHYDRCYGNRYSDRVYYNNGYYGRNNYRPQRHHNEYRSNGNGYGHYGPRNNSRHYRR